MWPEEFAPKEPLALLDAKFARQFRLEQARAFVWGHQPTVANYIARQSTQRPKSLDFALRLAKIRHRAVNRGIEVEPCLDHAVRFFIVGIARAKPETDFAFPNVTGVGTEGHFIEHHPSRLVGPPRAFLDGSQPRLERVA